MRHIELKPNDKDIMNAVLSISNEGMTIGDIRTSIKLMDKIEAATDVLDLEPAEHAFMVARFAATKFTRIDRSIVDLFDRLET